MEDKLKKEIAEIVENIFDSKKEDEMRQRTEKALRESASAIESLTEELAAHKDELDEVKSSLASVTEERDAAVAKVVDIEKAKEEEVAKVEKAKEDALSEAKAAYEELEKKLEEKANELEEIRKEALAKTRMEELETAGVISEDRDAQSVKVKEMSDEEFASYKEELVSIRSTIMASLEKEEPKKETASKKKEEDDGTPPANIDPAQAVVAALNMEVHPSEDMIEQYKNLGKALAASMKNDK